MEQDGSGGAFYTSPIASRPLGRCHSPADTQMSRAHRMVMVRSTPGGLNVRRFASRWVEDEQGQQQSFSSVERRAPGLAPNHTVPALHACQDRMQTPYLFTVTELPQWRRLEVDIKVKTREARKEPT